MSPVFAVTDMVSLFALITATVGLVVGSFLNVLILRLVEEESIVFPPSHCPLCKHRLAWYDLIPVLSFILLKGHCRYCRKKISWQYPLVEVATAGGFATVAWMHPEVLLGTSSLSFALFLIDLVLVAGLIALFVFDYRWFIVPDEVSLPLITIAVLAGIVEGVSWVSLVLGVVAGGGFYFVLWAASQGRWVGSGDIRLGALMGAMLAWPAVLIGLYLAYLIGGAVAAYVLITKRGTMKSMLPMGVFLTTATFVVLIFNFSFPEWWRTFIW